MTNRLRLSSFIYIIQPSANIFPIYFIVFNFDIVKTVMGEGLQYVNILIKEGIKHAKPQQKLIKRGTRPRRSKLGAKN
jgi:hypothetical protein